MPLFSRAGKVFPEASERWSATLEAALQVSEIAASAAPLGDAMRSMVSTAVQMVGAEQGSIMLLDDMGRDLVLVASENLPPEVTTGHRVPMGESVAGRVLATGRPLLLGDVDDDVFVNFVAKSRSISSSVIVPLRANGRGIGVLNLSISKASPSFTEDDLRVAQMLADQAAGIIYKSRLHEQAEHRAAGLMALVESSKGLLGTLDLDALMQHVLDGATRLAGSKEGFACLFDSETGSITRGVYRGVDKTMIRRLVERPEAKEARDRADVVDLGGPVPLVALGLRTPRGTHGVVVAAVDPSLARDRHDLLRAFGQQAASALGSAELHCEIQRKESELSAIIQGVANPIVLVDERDRIVAVNSAAEGALGISAVFSAGAAIENNIGHGELEKLLVAHGDVQAEVEVGNPLRTYKARATDVAVHGGATGRVLVMDDITTERQMVQTQRDFVAMIGHELRTPLTIIKGFAGTLLRQVRKQTVTYEHATQSLSTIGAKAGQLERLIEDLLYVSRIETREASLRIEGVNVRSLIETVVRDVIATYPGREVSIDAPPSLGWRCDETKIALVVRHLVDNALKYSNEPAEVTVRAFQEDHELIVEVADKGVGILSSDIPHVFDRFRQLDGSATREHGGIGVGLYVCAQLVRAHDGRIWVDSLWGKGTTLSFSLPRRDLPSQVVRLTTSAEERSFSGDSVRLSLEPSPSHEASRAPG